MTDEDFDDLDPEEMVTVIGLGRISLRTAVRKYIEASRNPGVLVTVILREAGEQPATFDVNDLDRMAQMERFR